VAHHFLLHCLGGPALFTVAGEQVRFRTRKHFALLIRLALDAGKHFTRDYLADLLWPDVAPKFANHSLAQGLSVIKAKIAREAVVIERARVGLAAGWIDVDAQHLSDGDVRIDGPFLDTFEIPTARPFEEWKDEHRARLVPQMRDCLVRLMDAARRIGDFATVERHATKLQELDPLAEEGIRGVMEARAWASDRSSALKAFARYESQLAEELGAKPGADIVRMADLLRDGRRAPRPAVAGYPPPRVDRRFEPETLIGREREFSVLYDAWLEARRKNPRIVVVTSDPGVGKTTLVNALASTCQMDGAVVARAQAYDAERELPFAVLAELVKQLATQRAIGSADPEALSELTRVTPEVVKAFPGVPKPADWSPELTPLRIADAFLKTVTAAAADSPVMLVVDDLHAADNASTAILHSVARKLSQARVLLIITARTNELRLSGAPWALTSDTRIDGMQTLELDVLAARAVHELIRRLTMKSSRVQPPVDRISRASGGNPLAVELLTREWTEHGPASLIRDIEALDTQPAQMIGIPRAIGAVFERQTRRLEPAIRATLDLAAVLGRRLTQVDLYTAIELSAGQAAEALSRLRDEGYLREVSGDLEFRNELIRAQAYYSVAGPTRQHLHREVAQLLARSRLQCERAACLEVAWHYVRGGQLNNAVAFGLPGAEQAVVSGAPAEAQQILEVLIPSEQDEERSRKMQLLLARALLDRSEAGKAMPILEALSKAESINARDLAEITRLLSNAEFLRAKSPRSIRATLREQALEAARRTDDLELVLKALLESAKTGKILGDREILRQTRCEVASIIDSGADSSAALLTLAYCDFYTHEIRSALLALERVADRGGSDLAQLSFAYSGIGSCHHMLCRFNDASKYFHNALEIALRLGDDSRASRILANLTMVSNSQANYGPAIAFGERSIELAKANPNQPELVPAYANLGDAYLLSGDRERAVDCLEKAKEWVDTHDDWQMTVVYLFENASRALTTGNVPLALNLQRELEKLTEGGQRFTIHAGLSTKLEALRTVHDVGPIGVADFLRERKNFFRDRVPFYYLDVLGAAAWIEKLCAGRYSTETEKELEIFESCGALGKRALLQAQGFLH
jgi:DNA-binding SARP family transcriptional activator/tetratricopeptide (TPR) repeat protein